MQIPVPGAADSIGEGWGLGIGILYSIPSDSDAGVPREGALGRHLSDCCDPLRPASVAPTGLARSGCPKEPPHYDPIPPSPS